MKNPPYQCQVQENLLLRKLEMKDAEAIFQTINSQRKYLGQWLPFVSLTKTLNDSQNFVSAVLNTPFPFNENIYSLLFEDRFVGLVGLKCIDWGNLRSEIGYWLSSSYQGKGFITQSVKKILEIAFLDLELNRIQIKCAVGNHKSSAIPRRLGFSFEGIEREGERTASSDYFDIEVYSLLRREYPFRIN